MRKRLFDLDDSNLNEAGGGRNPEIQKIAGNEVAIIGLYGKFAGTGELDGFWEALRSGKDCTRHFPESRKRDVENYLRFMGITGNDLQYEYHSGGFLDEIDQFDYNLFSISPKEAELMDPSQRIFLEAVWSAVEDSGYGGRKLSGTKTGIFLGYSSDFGDEYKKMIQVLNPQVAAIAATGNIKSIIASRIAYLLDLKGPSMVIDTACSSSLVAVHLASRALQNGDCELAIAGGVKVHVVPIRGNNRAGIGLQVVSDIESGDGKTRTFDHDSDGTVPGEGVGVVVLKPLARALSDRDSIYAIIKGSAINQDGNSIGITAPNSEAQQELICDAWRDAGIDPETITYFEAHGTGTKLGDPVEIDGIRKAFGKYTDKKQFCAIGSVKTNIGHLDGASGISGLIKAVLALKNKQLPASINFDQPNRKINFTESPVYVNDSLNEWRETGGPARCGISSFGLSGTNCHIVLEEAPLLEENRRGAEEHTGFEVLTLSAKSSDTLHNLIRQYQQLLARNSTLPLGDLCFTANTGRGHYQCRLAVITNSMADLQLKLQALSERSLETLQHEASFYGEHKVVFEKKELSRAGQITEAEKRRLSNRATAVIEESLASGNPVTLLSEICDLYVRGAEIQWDQLYAQSSGYRRRSGLPGYPFNRKRCWIQEENEQCRLRYSFEPVQQHPLLEACLVKTLEMEVYLIKFDVNRHWVVNEHLVNDQYVVPGTVYLELINEVFQNSFPGRAIEYEQITFINLLALDRDEVRDTHLILKLFPERTEFVICSRPNDADKWLIHVEGKAVIGALEDAPVFDWQGVKGRLAASAVMQQQPEFITAVKVGPRWNNFQEIYEFQGEHLVYLKLDTAYLGDLEQYALHPALMDCAVNAANPNNEQEWFLPFYYKKLKIYGRTPPAFYSYLKSKETLKPGAETIAFDITLFDESGKVFAQIDDYVIKKVRNGVIDTHQNLRMSDSYYQLSWIKKARTASKLKPSREPVLILKHDTGLARKMTEWFEKQGIETIEVDFGSEFIAGGRNNYTVGTAYTDYEQLMGQIRERGISLVLHTLTLQDDDLVASPEQLDAKLASGLYSLFYLVKAIINRKLKGDLKVVLVTDYTVWEAETGPVFKPHQAALFGLGKVVGTEYPNLQCRTIAVDETVELEVLMQELAEVNPPDMVVYHNGERLVEQFGKCDLLGKNEFGSAIHEGGVYVITGGTGALGLVTAKYIASKYRVKLGLVSRSGLPAREQWDQAKDDGQLAKIALIKEIEALGSEVICYRADVSRWDEMQAVVTDLRSRFGRINGVIHGAGVAGDGFIFRKDEHTFRSVVDPKIKGAWIIDCLTRDDNLDFLVLYSSINSVFKVAGQGDYTAANSYLDAFALERRREGIRTTTINWPAWRENGMAVVNQVDFDQSPLMALYNAEAFRILEETLRSDVARIIVGKLNHKNFKLIADSYEIQNELSRTTQSQIGDSKAVLTRSGRRDGGKVVITGKDVADLTETELVMAKVWAKSLGLEVIDVYDSFFSMGGDSILATNLLKEIEKVYPGVIDITDIFTYSTIEAMSSFIAQKILKKDDLHTRDVKTLTLSEIVQSLTQGELSSEAAAALMEQLEDREAWT